MAQSLAVHGFAGFLDSTAFDERVASFNLEPEVKVHLNAPSAAAFSPDKKTMLIFYALPNGNTTAQTVGHRLQPGDDWHFDIQHIGAQTRFLRQLLPNRNIVVAYLEANANTIPRSWPAWRKKNGDAPIPGIVAAVRKIFADASVEIVLSGHSGGGSFIFGYLNAVENIPGDVVRIAFLDSNYAYDPARGHAEKLRQWLESGGEHRLCVLAYNDAAARLNGRPFVTAKGGTWGRSQAMIHDLGGYFKFDHQTNFLWKTDSLPAQARGGRARFISLAPGTLEKISALNGRVEFFLKENPERKIFHTVQVERNGFIEAMVSGTSNEGKDFQYFGPRAYEKWIVGGKE